MNGREKKPVVRKHRMGLVVGMGSVIVVVFVAVIVLMVLSGSFSGILTDTGLADPPGGGLFVIAPSDKDGETVYSKDKSFSVTTIGKGHNPKCNDPYLVEEPARIEDVKFIGVKTGYDGRVAMRLDYKLVPEKDKFGHRAIGVLYGSITGPKDLKSGVGCPGYTFCLFPEKQCNEKGCYQHQTRYFQIRSYTSNKLYTSCTPIYKVSHI